MQYHEPWTGGFEAIGEASTGETQIKGAGKRVKVAMFESGRIAVGERTNCVHAATWEK